MKWQGREESVNIMDLRNITTIQFEWQGDTSNDFILGNKTLTSDSYVMLVNGKIVTSGGGIKIRNMTEQVTYLKVEIQKYDDNDPYLTRPQMQSIREIIKKYVNTNRDMKYESTSGSLREMIIATMENMKG